MSKIGTAKAATTVRYGPGSGIYASVGSIDANESVVVHGKENGWFCISYTAGSLLKRGYVPVGTFTDESELSTDAIITSGFSKTVKTAQTVYTGPIPANYAAAGSVSAGEIVTAFLPVSGDYTYIEYGTSSGVKRGYIPTSQLTNTTGKLAIMTADATVYYGPSTDYVASGSIASGEYCVIISRETPFGSSTKWCQIEYISGSSRKRGYIKQGGIVPYSSLSGLSAIKTVYGNAMMLSAQTVYTGPSTSYVTAGSVSLSEVIQTLGKTQESSSYTYIEYSTSSGKKRGYVAASSVSEEILFPNTMAQAATVYGGPSSTIYASIGSVASGEAVAVLAMENGWFAIEYVAMTQFKRGYVPASSLEDSATLAAGFSESSYTGYLDQVTEALSVYSGPSDSYATVGSLAADEAVTVISGASNGYAHVEYSTPSGTKRGYVPMASLTYQTRGILGKANSNASAYYGASASFIKSGGIYADEYVVVLDKETSSKYDTLWYYIEFNAASGRKRGFVAQNAITLCGTGASLGELKTGDHLAYAKTDLTVYNGPSDTYATVGSISASERVSVYESRSYESDYAFIEYCTASGVKMGYVLASKLITTSFGIPLPSTTVSPTIYGSSGTGKHNLQYYRIGTGPHALAEIFGVHGYEDAWAADGLELCKLANSLIETLAAEDDDWKSTWSVYVVPTANPDGITEGYTHNGPGRTTVSSGVDFNRCFPSNFVATYTARNYTGSQSLLAPEAKALYSTLKSIQNSSTTMRLLDIHGWLNTTYGDSELSAPFCTQFGIGNQSVMGGKGYLSRWVISVGIPAALIELPFPSSIAAISDNQYFTKLNAAIHGVFELEVAVPDNTVLCSPGSTGEEVGVLQAYLKYNGYLTADITEYYGSLTKEAVSAYQTANGIAASGNVDAATLFAMGFSANTAGTIHDNSTVYNSYLEKENFYLTYQDTRYESGRHSIQEGENYIRCIPAKKQLAFSVSSGVPAFSIETLAGGDSQIYVLTAMHDGYKISPKGYNGYVLSVDSSTLKVSLEADTDSHSQRWCIESNGDQCWFSNIECIGNYLCTNGSANSLFMNEEKLLWSCRDVIDSRRITNALKDIGVTLVYMKDDESRSALDRARRDNGGSNVFYEYSTYYLDYSAPILNFFDSTHEICERLRIQVGSAGISYLAEIASSGVYFYKRVNDEAIWDVKLPGVWNAAFNETLPYMTDNKFVFCGNLRTPEDLGNILYGYTGALFGFGKKILLWCGGAVAVRNSALFKQYCNAHNLDATGFPGFAIAVLTDTAQEEPFYGDSEWDHYAILEGFELAEQRNTVQTMVTDLLVEEAEKILSLMQIKLSDIEETEADIS